MDDVEEADILQHLVPAITFIQGEVDKGRDVLVHCQAGTSGYLHIYVTVFGCNLCIAGRSATVVAAYIMYSQHVDLNTAMDLIRKVRPSIKYDIHFAPG